MLLLSLVIFIDFMGFGLILPLTAKFQIIYDLSPFQVGLFSSSFSFACLLGSLVFGPLSDKFGRKPILLITYLFLSLSYFLSGYVQESTTTFNVLLILRLFIGFFSGNIPVVFATASDLSINNIERRRKNMAALGISIGLGFILGPTLGGVISQMTGGKTIAPFYFSCVLTLVLMVLLIFYYRESLKILKEKIYSTVIKKSNPLLYQLKQLLLNKQVLLISFLYFSFFFTFSGLEVYLLTETLSDQLHLSQLYLGLVWTVFAVFNSIFQVVLLKLARMRVALILGFLIYAFGILMFVFTSSSLFLVILTMIICAAGSGFVMPNLNTAISLEGTPNQQGTIFGINQSLGNLGRTLGPFILGALFNMFNTVNAVWIAMSALIFIGSFVIIKYIPANSSVLKSRHN